MTGRG